MQSVVGAGHALRRHPLDPLLASLALFDSPGDLDAKIDALFNVSLSHLLQKRLVFLFSVTGVINSR